MERMQCDWNELNNAQEVEIIKKYSAIGRFLTIFCTRKQHVEFSNALNSIQTLII
jgi:hypothetical protein